MKERSFTIEVEIDAPTHSVHAFLLDLDHLAPLHPLIESIELLESRVERPAAKRYRVVDQIPVGPFKMQAIYVAELEAISDTEVCGRAWQSPKVILETRYRLSPLGARRSAEAGTSGSDDGVLGSPGGTHLEERVRIQAPFGLRSFVAAQAFRAHETTLSKMKRLLEERAPAAAGRGAL
ncbi:MAG: SRPBCC family protein [Myxococcota bacterium]